MPSTRDRRQTRRALLAAPSPAPRFPVAPDGTARTPPQGRDPCPAASPVHHPLANRAGARRTLAPPPRPAGGDPAGDRPLARLFVSPCRQGLSNGRRDRARRD